MKMTPRYPVFIPSKGRANLALTAGMFARDGVPFKVVVEPQEVEAYERAVGADRLCVLPENNRGLVYSRNWIKTFATAEGHERHWQFDDDIKWISRIYKGYRLRCPSNVALSACEDFVDKYENVALASLNSEFFLPVNGTTRLQWPPFYLNSRCYTCFLVLNALPNRWRNRYNEDTDMTLQVLSDGWCTILFNAFAIRTPATMTSGGGQTPIYVSDGRLHMARQLERIWPGVVTTMRRFHRPQHHVKGHWTKFDTPLKRKPGFDASDAEPNEYGMTLKAVAPVKSASLRRLLEDEIERKS
jgi:hypothetical protein